MRGQTAVPEEETIAYGAGDIGFDFGFLVRAVLAITLEARSTLTGMMTGGIHVEGLVAQVTPIGMVHEFREGGAAIIMALMRRI